MTSPAPQASTLSFRRLHEPTLTEATCLLGHVGLLHGFGAWAGFAGSVVTRLPGCERIISRQSVSNTQNAHRNSRPPIQVACGLQGGRDRSACATACLFRRSLGHGENGIRHPLSGDVMDHVPGALHYAEGAAG